MFYSHEILTSRQGGVATVWLVATLGSKSNLKRVNRKAILDVDVPKTCEIIIKPMAPMALRLQSNLLYGVSRVFAEQCGYILSDAQTAHSNLRTLLKAVRTAELDPNAGKARPGQLVLPDDPAFLPELFLPGLDIDLSALDISTDESSRRSSILSPHSQRSSLSSNKDADESVLGLIIPTSDIGGVGDFGGFILPDEDRASIRPSAGAGGIFDDNDEEGFNLDPGFTIDEEGNLIVTAEQENPQSQSAMARLITRAENDSRVSGLVSRELQGELGAGQPELPEIGDLALNLDIAGDDYNMLPEADAFQEVGPQVAVKTDIFRSSSAVREEDSSSSSAEALLRRRRRALKELPYDDMPELRNADLARWNNDYLTNMANESKTKFQSRAPKLSKRNAAFWVGGSGLGNISRDLKGSHLENPLSMFAGDALMEALTGVSVSVAGKKRDRDEEGDLTYRSEERRVRRRDGGENELDRIENLPMNDEEALAILNTEEIEMGRDAQLALEDQSFPWNSALAMRSRPGSVARGIGFPSSVGGFSASGGRLSSIIGAGVGPPSSLDRRANRVTNASPLHGRGLERYSSLELPTHHDDEELLGGQDVSGSKGPEEFHLYGPGADVSTQTAAESQWMRATLDLESNNFLGYLKAEISDKLFRIEEENNDINPPQPSVLFEELLPPLQHTKIVAAQALHHVLALATKNLITIRQDVNYGPIDLGLSAGI